MSEPLSSIPNGMRYYFGREGRLRRGVEETAMSVLDGWSYEEITTPAIDYYSLFERGMGQLEAHRAFRFTDADGRLLALRPDVTSGIARAASTLLAERERPLRLCYAAPVFRQQGQSHTEWRRESMQIGCELTGANTTTADLEVLVIAAEILNRLGLDRKFVITLNDVEFFNGVAEQLALNPTQRDEMRQLVDARNVGDLERFFAGHASSGEVQGLAPLIEFSAMQSSDRPDTLERARQITTNQRSRAALDRLETLWRIIESLGLTNQFEIDLGDVSRLDYYTGLTFKIYVSGAGARVGSGGRYDNLTANFGGAEPAIGFVLDLDALTDVLLLLESDSILAPQRPGQSLQVRATDPTAVFHEAIQRRAAGERVLVKALEVTE